MLKEQKGITLIALVITIIVLLILAGVSIAMLTGQNGILTKATTSKTETAKAEVMERINMELNAVYADVLSGDITALEDDYVTKINDNLAEKATATKDTDKKVLTITPKDSTLGISAGKVDLSKKTITAAKETTTTQTGE